MRTVLAVEDCTETRNLIHRTLESEGALPVTVGSLAEARAWLEGHAPDLVVLDIQLPDGEGYSLCSELRADDRLQEVPILFLTSRQAIQDKLAAFSLGADDFLAKSFDPLELKARVKARLERGGQRSEAPEVVRRGPLCLRLGQYRAGWLESGSERDLELTPQEFRMLYTLARRETHVLSREQLREAVWGQTVVGPRTVDTHMSNLRRKLAPHQGCIESVRGVGYRFRTPAAPGSGS